MVGNGTNGMKILGPERLKKAIDWRHLFTEEQLRSAEMLRKNEKIKVDYRTSLFRVAKFYPGTGSPVRAKLRVQVSVQDIPNSPDGEWKPDCFVCSCAEGRRKGSVCAHAAAVMLDWEEELGEPFFAQEPEWIWRQRVEKEERYLRKQEYLRGMAEAAKDFFPVSGILTLDRPKRLVLYDLNRAAGGFVTTAWAAREAKKLGPGKAVVRETETRDGRKYVIGMYSGWNSDIQKREEARMVLTGAAFTENSCSCLFHEQEGLPEGALCPHQLLILQALRGYVDRLSNEDLTDEAARKFFAHLQQAEKREERKTAAREPEKIPDLMLAPRIVVEDGVAQVSFKVGSRGGKMLMLRNLRELLRARANGGVMELSKTESLDFGTHDFAPEAAPWLTFIQRRVTELEDVNEQLYAKANPWRRPVALSITSQQPLSGAVLDQFYELADGKTCEYTDKSNGIKGEMITVGYTRMRFTLTIDRILDTAGQFGGIMVSGMIPVMLEGASAVYNLNSRYLSRMDTRETGVLAPFRDVADASGLFRFRVGLDHLQEFYYRALPSLLASPYIRIVDHGEGEPQKYLPPEPQFSFYLDLADDMLLSCRCRVAYGDREYFLDDESPEGEYRDTRQEERIRAVLKETFPWYDSLSKGYRARMTDDGMYDFLQAGIGLLEKYGDVHGTEAFKRRSVKPFSSVRVGVSVQSGIMDIDVTSKEYSQEELLEILDSYQKKKRYYRLRSGDYVELEENSELEELAAFFGSLDLAPLDAIRQKIHLPLYRALYLDRMLEEHQNLAASRDRTYRALIKNFQTVRDADYETPSVLENTLRPYQVFGYKWLKTLEEAGFGGILADEMGLGKTVQMIALFQNHRESGNGLPSLVVCPASLVYNWQAEIGRFAPGLTARTVTGTAGARKAVLEEAAAPAGTEADTAGPAEGTGGEIPPAAGERKKPGRKAKREAGAGRADVYITSYDLLKRDIALYEGLHFHICVLDEAQFIKNQKAAAAKSVKLIRADHRFALTGTPIENRLSELWSIFDFLMPGFLYTSADFVRRFEIPISRDQNEEMTARLKKMAGPFILRRLKGDVLKDLPRKLEEVRYARFEGEQQKLYDAQVVHMRQMIRAGGNSGEDKIRILAELTRIRQICCDPSLLFEDYRGESAKRGACMDLVQSAIDGGHRMLIFSQFTSMLALLEQDLRAAGISCFKITGSTPKEERISLVNQFNEGETPVFLISLKAGGTGLNLTGADVVIHYDPWWNLAAQNQATDRAHRIGQTRQVTVYRMIARDTIEEKIMELQEAKQDLADAILSGRSESLMSLSSEELLELLN